jgi:hypothetical protein
MAQNTKWEDHSTHTTIYHVKITLQLVGGWSAFYGHFPATIGGFFSWLWTNLQDFMWGNFKQKAIRSYNWELPCLHLHGFCDYGFMFIAEMREMGAI